MAKSKKVTCPPHCEHAEHQPVGEFPDGPDNGDVAGYPDAPNK